MLENFSQEDLISMKKLLSEISIVSKTANEVLRNDSNFQEAFAIQRSIIGDVILAKETRLYLRDGYDAR
jgi:hypothetical protein